MSTHKLTAGDGYLYLIRQTAAADGTDKGRSSLNDYYSAKGESPGRWVGRGVASLAEPSGRTLLTDTAQDLWRVEEGSQVSEDQMKALYGLGMHPNAAAMVKHLIAQGAPKNGALQAAKLGRPFHINDGHSELQRRVAVAYRDHNLSQAEHWNSPIDDALRAQMRTTIAREMFAEEYGREPADDRELTGYIARGSRELTTSVAGYDLTFTPVKSISVLWALAPLEVSRIIEQAHDRAVADALEYLQDNAAFTRTGSQGVAQIDTDGFIAAVFTHRDSRAGDPNLHSHVAVSNKVRAVGADGIARWLALDGRPLFKSTVAASELYNTRMEGYLGAALGMQFADRADTERGKRAVREIEGIPTPLCDVLSSRRAAIEHRYAELAKQFQDDHGREPTTPEAIALSQQATLETRPAKHEPRSLAEQRQQWRGQAIAHLGGQSALSGLLARVLSGRRRPTPHITAEWIDEQAAAVIETVAESRSIWQRTHVFAEAQRRVRAQGVASDPQIAEAITAAALKDPYSVAHARDHDADLGEPQALRRRNGASVYSTHGTELYTNEAILAAERRIIAAAHRHDGRQVSERAVDMALLEQHAKGRSLNAGQEALVRHMACTGARVALALAPAGTGKTTAMATLARAWEEEGGRVVGLAPSANAAQVLRDDMRGQGLHINADTIDKLVWLHRHPDAPKHDSARSWFDTIDHNTLIIVDEAGKAGTFALDTVISTALARGATVRLIGDDKQLSSISAGGVLRDIAATAGSVTLTEVMRFSSRAEAAATLALREGDPAGLAFYADNHRVHVGADTTAADMAFQRWRADRANGWDSLLLAPTNEAVAELNERARLDRLSAAADDPHAVETPGGEAELSDGLRASVGDIITTRKNRRALRLGGARDFVRNGYRWTVMKVGRSGSLTVAHLDTGLKVTLPSWYVRDNVTLGYAATIDSAQGITVGNRKRNIKGSCHIVGCDTLTRQQVYTALTRAIDENHIYLSTAEHDPHRILTPKATHPDTAIDVLTRCLARDDAQVSATTGDRQSRDPFRRLAHAGTRYLDAIGEMAQLHLGAAAMADIDHHAETLHPGLTQQSGWPVLRKHLAIIGANDGDPITRLTAAVGHSDLSNAADAAAVLDWRLDPTGEHSAGVGPLRWLPAIPTALAAGAHAAPFLQRRATLVADLAEQIRDTARTWTPATAPPWARPISAVNPRLAAEIAVYRAAFDVPDADTRLTGPDQYPARARAIQQLLERHAAALLGRPGTESSRWDTLIDSVDTRIRRDPYWPQLAAHLSTVARTGVDLHQLLADTVEHGPLPDEMPGAALWWRLCGTLTPATLDISSTHLRPPWLADLHDVFGSALAETIAADPAFPGLVAAVAATDSTRWTPRDLLHVAFEHLHDVDHEPPLRPDEYARLLTYSIDLFTTEHPFDHDIPIPAEPPQTPEESEALRHHYPDPEQPDHPNPQHSVGDDELLQLLGYAPDATAPEDPEQLPPDPAHNGIDTAADLDGLTFDDLLTERPITRPLQPALNNVAALRTAYQHASADIDRLEQLVRESRGPAAQAALPELLKLRARADADRPYMLAVHDVIERWDEAEAAYEHALRHVEWARQQLDTAQADPHADPLDVASARAGVKLATMLMPSSPPAERFHAELTEAIAARAHAAGGADKVVTSEDVDSARLAAENTDRAALRAAIAARNQLRAELDRAEIAAAAAFAEAQTRNADDILDRIDALHTELSVLNAAGGYQLQRRLHIPSTATDHLDPMTARAVAALATNGFTVTPVHAGDDREALDALSLFHAAASAQNKKVLWCTPTTDLAERALAAGVADTIAHIDNAHQYLRDGSWQLPAESIVVLDHAADMAPHTIADFAEHAAQQNASLLLIDPGDNRWPQPPSAALLKLLHHDLPWSVTLSTAEPTPERRRHAQPDLDPVLEQADRYDPNLLPPDVIDALNRRHALRDEYRSAHRFHNMLWRVTDAHANDHSTDQGIQR
ncbi:MAG: relaxase domain-containing protein [Mycobacteriaceae bacterium]|nr:relaxase domain-containing protein [Mycobacteriaceae bacterium]